MFSIELFVSSLTCAFSLKTESSANVIFARPFRSNTSDVNSGQNYPNAHLVFVTESNRGVLSSTPFPELRTMDGDSPRNEV
ncbi:hypothetical protein TNCT_499191 [Trichonephila clavata]|uniref:Uncharacterized protein n=1 Tax=Trichonephila clavata TaxID=2740835 RepID=A0A8X6J0R3_TRICU|nr:hypothetical protein TNCT_499191 [Trichonephila clavata]